MLKKVKMKKLGPFPETPCLMQYTIRYKEMLPFMRRRLEMECELGVVRENSSYAGPNHH